MSFAFSTSISGCGFVEDMQIWSGFCLTSTVETFIQQQTKECIDSISFWTKKHIEDSYLPLDIINHVTNSIFLSWKLMKPDVGIFLSEFKKNETKYEHWSSLYFKYIILLPSRCWNRQKIQFLLGSQPYRHSWQQ